MRRWPPRHSERALDEAKRVLGEGPFFNGPWTQTVEDQLRELTGAREAVAFPSCSIAIHAALLALTPHIRPRILAPTFTFVGSVAGAAQMGARLILTDVEQDTLTISDEFVAAQAEARMRVADVVLAVDLHGVPHGWPRGVVQGVPVLTDACQSLGTVDRWGKQVASVGSGAAAWSFSPAKGAPAAGGGGAVTTDDLSVAQRLRELRHYGIRPGDGQVATVKYGQNWLPSEALMVLVSDALEKLGDWAPLMHEQGERLRAAALEGGLRVQQPPAGAEVTVAWHKVRVGRWDGRLPDLMSAGVPTHHWGDPLHKQRAFSCHEQQVSGYPASDAAEQMVCLGTEANPPWCWTETETAAAEAVLRRGGVK